jgi:phage-related minor tail protein
MTNMDEDRIEAVAPGLSAAAEDLRALDAAARSAAGSVSGGLTRALTRLTQGSETVGGALRRLSSEMAAAALRSAFRPIGDAAGAALGQAAAHVVGSAATGLSGAVRGFALGGVIDRPTFVGAGVAGEAGPEAILPLARGADGRLGVRGGGGGVTVNIATQDAESFRRSEAQIAATLARAVARGRRKL